MRLKHTLSLRAALFTFGFCKELRNKMNLITLNERKEVWLCNEFKQ